MFYLKIVRPLTDLQRESKDVKNSEQTISWTGEAKKAFAEIKHQLSQDTLLRYPDFSK